jgi:hypothetical protein
MTPPEKRLMNNLDRETGLHHVFKRPYNAVPTVAKLTDIRIGHYHHYRAFANALKNLKEYPVFSTGQKSMKLKRKMTRPCAKGSARQPGTSVSSRTQRHVGQGIDHTGSQG